MSKQSKEMILEDSPEAAQIKTVTGWVSRAGRFWGNDERMARFDGCTHRKCDKCGTINEIRSYCRTCYEASQRSRYEAMPRAAWDSVSMLYSDECDRYFEDLDEVYDYLAAEDSSVILDDLRLIICKPNHARPLTEDLWGDDLPDEGCDEIPHWLEEAIGAFNKAIEGMPPLSWSPGKTALDTTGMDQRPRAEADHE